MCPICTSRLEPKILCQATLGGKAVYDLVECDDCGVRHLSPLPSDAQLQDFYRPEYYGTDWFKQLGLGKAFAKIVLRGKPPGNFLDIGCGLGFFIEGIRNSSKWQTDGFEFSPQAADFARRELGLDVRSGDLCEAQFSPNHFDYIQIRNVLEHVVDPMALLRECRRLLKPDGVLHLCVPNGWIDSMNIIEFFRKEKRPAYSRSGHLYFFPRRTLVSMLQAADLRIVRARTYGIRRGLAVLGLWPRFKDWKRDYNFERREDTSKCSIVLPPKKHRPDIYYLYRLARLNFRMLPGMRKFGLDYELLIKPRDAK